MPHAHCTHTHPFPAAALQKYDGSEDADLDSLFSHLTNASINKKNPERDSRRSVMGAGAKWTLARFQSYLQHRRGADVAALWRRIEAVINLSLLPLVTAVPPNAGCFELFGFDIILDAALRPWVLEVNCSPSLGAVRPAQRPSPSLPHQRGRAVDAATLCSSVAPSLPTPLGTHLPRCGPAGRTARRTTP